jgi:hypothetical protein
MTKSYFFSCQEIHRLDFISGQPEPSIQVGDSSFKYSIEQLAFHSPLAVSHFQETSDPFFLTSIPNQ